MWLPNLSHRPRFIDVQLGVDTYIAEDRHRQFTFPVMFPMVEFEMPPSDYAIRMRPWFVASLVMLMVLVVGKFIISDYWGAVSLFFVVLMGVLVLSGEHGISATNALFYSVMAMISGIFDVISCMLYFQHSKYRAFESGAPNIVILAQLIFICSPIALFISSFISYSIFSDCQQHTEEWMAAHRGPMDFGPNYGGIREQHPQRHAPAPGGQRQDANWNRFQGQGHRLGG